MVRKLGLISSVISIILCPLVVSGDDFSDRNDKLWYGRSRSSVPIHGRVVGHIQKSTDPLKIVFGIRDLVYIKIKHSEDYKLQVGDRYIVNVQNSVNSEQPDFRSLNSDAAGQAGMVEIICVGEHTALGIILKAERSIVSGLTVSCDPKLTSGKLSSGDLKTSHANQITSF